MPEPPPGNSQAARRKLDPKKCLRPGSNRPIRDEELVELLEDIRRHGQLVAGIAAPSATLAGFFDVAAGNRRCRCCEILGIPFEADVRTDPFGPGEIVRISVSDHLKRKNPNVIDLCNEITAFKREMGIETWAEVAEQLGISPATISRILGVKRLPPELRQKLEAAGVGGTVIQIVSRVSAIADMTKAADYACTKSDKGELPTKERVEGFIQKFKGEEKRGSKPTSFTVNRDGLSITFKMSRKLDSEQFIAATGEVMKVLRENRHIDPEGFPFLF